MPYNIEITFTSKPLRDVNFNLNKRNALIVGNERTEAIEKMPSLVPNFVYIEMYGNNYSLNVFNALAI